jgi:hypothetical protein
MRHTTVKAADGPHTENNAWVYQRWMNHFQVLGMKPLANGHAI